MFRTYSRFVCDPFFITIGAGETTTGQVGRFSAYDKQRRRTFRKGRGVVQVGKGSGVME